MNKYNTAGDDHKVSILRKDGEAGSVTQFPSGAAYRLHPCGAVTNVNPKPYSGKAQRKALKKARRILDRMAPISPPA